MHQEEFLINPQPHRPPFFRLFLVLLHFRTYLQFPQLMSLDSKIHYRFELPRLGILDRPEPFRNQLRFRSSPQTVPFHRLFVLPLQLLQVQKFPTQNPEMLLLVLRKFLCFAVLPLQHVFGFFRARVPIALQCSIVPHPHPR